MTLHDLNPGPLLDLSGGYWQTCALHAGVKLDVFTRIGDGALPAGAVADAIGADRRATAMLLDALAAMELLKKDGDRYSNREMAAVFLVKTSPRYIGYIIQHHRHLVQAWSQLDQAVITGKPVRERASFDDEEVRESFLMGMFNIAMNLAPQVAEAVDLTGRSHLLDLGGGPGTYGIHFCRKNPGLKATVFDLPTTRPFAEKTIDRFGLSDRIDFVPGDFTRDAIEGNFDAAWLSHILHGEGPDTCRKIVDKAVTALSPGGMILIHEFILDDSRDGPLFPALFSLNMLTGTPSGQAYSEGELRDMLEEAGAVNVRRLAFRGPTDSGIMAGDVP